MGKMGMDCYNLDGHKLYWHLDRVLQWQKGDLIPPVYLEISPVSYCNHNCVFCGKDFARDQRHRLDTGLTCRRLEEMGRLGVRSIMFAGEGEPLMHEDLARMVATAKGAGIDVSITTNGSLGSSQRWAELLPHLTWLRFSLDAGSAEAYASVHGVAPKVFGQTLASLEAALELRDRMGLETTIGVQYLVLPENWRDIENALERFTRLGVDYLALKPFSLNPKMLRHGDVAYQEEMIEHLDQVTGRYQGRSRTNVIFRREAMNAYMNRSQNYRHCHALPFWGYICASGDLYTCAVFIGDERFKAGNINQQDMAEVFFGQARRDSVCLGQRDLSVGEECRLNCRMARANEFLEHLSLPPQHVNFI